MLINDILKEKKISKYKLSKESCIPYATISDICNGKTNLMNCSVSTVYSLSKSLNISMETLVESSIIKRISFDLFKSNVCHSVKELGDIDFIIQTLESNKIRKYYQMKWFPESLYLLAMLDYISRINDIQLCSEYNDLRQCKLSEPIFPSSIIATSIALNSDSIKETALRESIPEFLRFNIIESEILNVC